MPNRSIALCLLILLLPVLSAGAPVIIYDSGRTTPLPDQPDTVQVQTPVTADFSVHLEPLPVTSPTLSPGKVEARSLDRRYLERPVFMVGADGLSLRWLAVHQARLKQHQAIGIAVNVDTAEHLQQLQQAAGGLVIYPLAGDALAEQLDLTHYPVLISPTRIEQ
ncbi:integrating conjugative element protein [Methylophaga sp.]|uniref:integrating conjugative element protein n=1 Tax=Methylophaga sp. TaxID=2024840 RepID=UPI002726A623|nr:integrating conjugative element protein [Methylophaga sp.]MDO8828242.1 integrating conjugative element protein [Methylophaga sp.]